MSTLHFYERHELIRSVGRKGLRRQYEPDVIDRLAVVIICQRAGFTLDEIAELLATGGEPTWKALVEAKLAALRTRIEHLTEVQAGLEHALLCPSENVLRCDHFRAELAGAIPVTTSTALDGTGSPGRTAESANPG